MGKVGMSGIVYFDMDQKILSVHAYYPASRKLFVKAYGLCGEGEHPCAWVQRTHPRHNEQEQTRA
jgi:hypothetical protein